MAIPIETESWIEISELLNQWDDNRTVVGETRSEKVIDWLFRYKKFEYILLWNLNFYLNS